MPSYNEIATVSTKTGGESVPSRYPVGDDLERAAAVFTVLTPDGLALPMRTVEQLVNQWVPFARLSVVSQGTRQANLKRPYVSVPLVYRDHGKLVDSTIEWNALAANTQGAEITIHDALAPGHDLVMAFNGGVLKESTIRFNVNLDGHFLRYYTLTSITETTDFDLSQRFMSGLSMSVEIGGEQFLPDRPQGVEQDFWCRADALTGDFSQLIVGGSEFEEESTRAVRLETVPTPILEDLENTIIYEKDVNGLPIRWLITGTEKEDGVLYLNLSSTQ